MGKARSEQEREIRTIVRISAEGESEEAAWADFDAKYRQWHEGLSGYKYWRQGPQHHSWYDLAEQKTYHRVRARVLHVPYELPLLEARVEKPYPERTEATRLYGEFVGTSDLLIGRP
jgi:hypothetical protein